MVFRKLYFHLQDTFACQMALLQCTALERVENISTHLQSHITSLHRGKNTQGFEQTVKLILQRIFAIPTEKQTQSFISF